MSLLSPGRQTVTRRALLQTATAGAVAHHLPANDKLRTQTRLAEFGYADVSLAPESLPEMQRVRTLGTLSHLSEDDLVKPFRMRAGLPAPGPGLGGWYAYVDPNPHSNGHGLSEGFCPGHAFGQWLSCFSRSYAIDRDAAMHAKITRLLDRYAPTITPAFYKNFRFPAYVFDKLNIGLIDAYRYAGFSEAKDLFARTNAAASQHLPPRPLNRDEQLAWRKAAGDNTTEDFTWDESYTLPENLFLASAAGLGDYRAMARRYLLDRTWFDPLSRNENVLAGKHAYSYCNSLSSGAQAWFDSGDRKYLDAATNGFRMIREQSFASGGWGPNERFGAPASDHLYRSLSTSSSSFETPCGSYAHFKITRYLLRITGDAAYGDSMERVFYNTVLGALPLEADGHAFYYSDYSGKGHKFYHRDRWPCCSGTLPQVTADYRLLAYFHDTEGVFVNLYLPSSLRFTPASGAACELTTTTAYPLDGDIHFRLAAKRPSRFALRFRIPQWSRNARIAVNGQSVPVQKTGGWATVTRRWHDGDRIDLSLHLPLRHEPIDAMHPDTVALLRGPLVLLALGHDVRPVRSTDLLSAKATGERSGEWQAASQAGKPLQLKPFTAIGGESYTTYFQLTNV